MEPVSVIDAPPLVGMLLPPATIEIAGGVYDTVPTEDALVCAPTVICHTRFAPIPAALVHWICVLAIVTVQALAVYVVPFPAPYDALTTFPLVGPKFVPSNVIVAPPVVEIEDPPETATITGAVYETVATDAALACAPTVAIHTSPAPTPAALVH